MKTIFSLLTFLILFTSSAFAGHGMGNGGHIMACYSDSTKAHLQSLKFFDHWEGTSLHGEQVELGAAELSVDQKIDVALARMKKFDPSLATNVALIAKNLAANLNQYLVNGPIDPTDDAHPYIQPANPNCFIEQFAAQYSNPQTNEKRYAINANYFNSSLVSNDDRAGLLLHEALYRTAIIQSGVTNSDGVRQLNFALSTQSFEELPVNQLPVYTKLLQSAGLYNYNCKLMDGFLMQTVKIHADPTLQVCYTSAVKFGNLEIVVPQNFERRDAFAPGYFIEFLTRDQSDVVHVNFLNSTDKLSITGTSVEIEPKADLVMVTNSKNVVDGSDVKFKILDQTMRCAKVEIMFSAGEIQGCIGSPSNRSWITFGRKIVKSDLAKWTIVRGTQAMTLPVYGSKLGLTVRLDPNADVGFSSVAVTDNMEVVEFNAANSLMSGASDIKVNNFTYTPSYFKVSQAEGGLKFDFRAGKLLNNPALNGKKYFLDQANTKNFADLAACKFVGLFGGGTINSTEEKYITASGAHYLNVITGEDAYKTDEKVQEVTAISCKWQQFSTNLF